MNLKIPLKSKILFSMKLCFIQCSLQYYKPPTIHFFKKERKSLLLFSLEF